MNSPSDDPLSPPQTSATPGFGQPMGLPSGQEPGGYKRPGRSTTRLILVALLPLAVLIVVCLVWIGGRHRTTDAGKGVQGPPSVVLETVAALTSGNKQEEQAVLAPAFNSTLPSGAVLPNGSRIVLDRESWRESGKQAQIMGTLYVPSQQPQTVEIGLVELSGRWLVTFEGNP